MPPEMRPFLPERDADEVAGFVALSFPEWSGPRHAWYLRNLDSKDWKDHRCLVDGGRLVAYLAIRPREMYIGRALLKMAGVAIVCTHPDARLKGYGRMLMDDALGFISRDGYDISVLYGIPDYYHKFGYEVVMATHHVTVPQAELPNGSATFSTSGIEKDDMPAIRALYNAQTRFRDGNCRRREMEAYPGPFKLTDKRGRIAAYASWYPSEGTMFVNEAIARDAEAARELLLAVKAVALREGLGKLTIQMPPGYPVTDLLTSANSTYYRDNARRRGCMGRVISLSTLARKMRAEWSALVARSELASKSGALALGIGDDILKIAWKNGTVSVSTGIGKAASHATQERFIQMIHGYRSVADLAGDPDVRFRPADIRPLEVLFPVRNAFLFAPDQF